MNNTSEDIPVSRWRKVIRAFLFLVLLSVLGFILYFVLRPPERFIYIKVVEEKGRLVDSFELSVNGGQVITSQQGIAIARIRLNDGDSIIIVPKSDSPAAKRVVTGKQLMFKFVFTQQSSHTSIPETHNIEQESKTQRLTNGTAEQKHISDNRDIIQKVEQLPTPAYPAQKQESKEPSESETTYQKPTEVVRTVPKYSVHIYTVPSRYKITMTIKKAGSNRDEFTGETNSSTVRLTQGNYQITLYHADTKTTYAKSINVFKEDQHVHVYLGNAEKTIIEASKYFVNFLAGLSANMREDCCLIDNMLLHVKPKEDDKVKYLFLRGWAIYELARRDKQSLYRLAEAKELLNQAYSLSNRQDGFCQYFLGEIHKTNREYYQAIEAYRNAVSLLDRGIPSFDLDKDILVNKAGFELCNTYYLLWRSDKSNSKNREVVEQECKRLLKECIQLSKCPYQKQIEQILSEVE